MPYAYMSRGDYYRGDYYRGDPFLGGLFKAIGGAAKKLLPVAASILPGPVGAIARIGGRVLTGAAIGTGIARAIAPPITPPGLVPVPGFEGAVERFLPGGETGFMKRRRMNVANPKALRRALRRVAGFGKLAKRARRDIGRAASAVGSRRPLLRAPKSRR